jgi:hypothetical protein
MKRLLSARWTPAALVAVVMLLAGGGYALASASNSITLCVAKHGGAVYKARKCKKHDSKLTFSKQGPQGKTGAKGATGSPGTPGTPGSPGPSGTVAVASWAGAVAAIPVSSGFVFAGPQATVTTNATQVVTATGSAALGTTTGSAGILLSICKEPSTGGTISTLGGSVADYQSVTATTARVPFGNAWTGTPGAGTWLIGECVDNTSATQAVDSNDWSTGYAAVIDASTAGTLARGSSVHHG